jgi:hypothetical protein
MQRTYVLPKLRQEKGVAQTLTQLAANRLRQSAAEAAALVMAFTSQPMQDSVSDSKQA